MLIFCDFVRVYRGLIVLEMMVSNKNILYFSLKIIMSNNKYFNL